MRNLQGRKEREGGAVEQRDPVQEPHGEQAAVRVKRDPLDSRQLVGCISEASYADVAWWRKALTLFRPTSLTTARTVEASNG